MDPLTIALIAGGGLAATGGGLSIFGGARSASKARKAAKKQAKEMEEMLKRMEAEYKRAYEEARQENLKRYSQIIGENRQLYRRTMKDLTTGAEQMQADVRSAARGATARAGQGLVDRGLGGTSLASNVQQAGARMEGESLARINQALQGQRSDIDERLTGLTTGVMERRQDLYPDLDRLNELQWAAMQARHSIPQAPGFLEQLGPLLGLVGSLGMQGAMMGSAMGLFGGGGGAGAAPGMGGQMQSVSGRNMGYFPPGGFGGGYTPPNSFRGF